MEFRNLFFSCLDASYPAAEARQLIAERRHDLLDFPPDQDLLSEPTAGTPEDFKAAVDRLDREVSPVDLYRQGVAAEVATIPRREVDAALRARPLTVVVLPGFLGELIDTRSFDEVFAGDSAGRERWRQAIEQFRRDHSGSEVDETLFDERFSFERLTLDRDAPSGERRPLTELVEVGSIDDGDGRALVTAVLLRPAPLSLETCDRVERLAEIARRRLEKFFRVIGLPENLVLLGYSMGALVALEMLARGREADAPWLGRVRAMISLGGPLFGSLLADQALDPGARDPNNPLRRQIELLRALAGELREIHGRPWRARPAVIAANTRAWLRFFAGMRRVVKGLKATGLKLRLPSLLRSGKRADFRPTLGLIGAVAFERFNVLNPLHYSLNIRKLKHLVEAALAASEDLSASERVRWWAGNLVPTAGMRYYALAGTMADSDLATPSGPLGANATAYNPSSLDHEIMIHIYRHLSGGILLNDSLVAVGRARFWRRWIELLNPAYRDAGLDASFLGVLGIHHWGLALRVVNARKDGSVNPFPREALLKALAARVAMDLRAS